MIWDKVAGQKILQGVSNPSQHRWSTSFIDGVRWSCFKITTGIAPTKALLTWIHFALVDHCDKSVLGTVTSLSNKVANVLQCQSQFASRSDRLYDRMLSLLCLVMLLQGLSSRIHLLLLSRTRALYKASRISDAYRWWSNILYSIDSICEPTTGNFFLILISSRVSGRHGFVSWEWTIFSSKIMSEMILRHECGTFPLLLGD